MGEFIFQRTLETGERKAGDKVATPIGAEQLLKIIHKERGTYIVLAAQPAAVHNLAGSARIHAQRLQARFHLLHRTRIVGLAATLAADGLKKGLGEEIVALAVGVPYQLHEGSGVGGTYLCKAFRTSRLHV